MSETYGLVDVESVEHASDPDPDSGKQFARLTDRLGSAEVRINTCTIPPGEEGPYHRHESQEEVYVLLSGTGSVTVDGESVEVPEKGVVRVPATLPRKLVNDSGAVQRWLMIGAPPVGTADDFGGWIPVEE